MNDTLFFLDVARICSAQSSCLKRKYGAVIVKNRKIISTGYNGAPVKMPHCTECARMDVPHGTDYTGCPSVHAEQNALIQAGRDAAGATVYVYGPGNDAKPCHLCTKLMINAGIVRVVYVDADANIIDITPEQLYKEWIQYEGNNKTKRSVRGNDIPDRRDRPEVIQHDPERTCGCKPGRVENRRGVPVDKRGPASGSSPGYVVRVPGGQWFVVTVDG